MGPAIPIILIVLTCGAYARKSKEKKKITGMTAARTLLYNNALDSKDAENMRKTADLFEAQKDKSIQPYADMLRKRAALRDLTKAQKEARREAFRQALRSQDVKGIEDMARASDKVGATGAAVALRKYAKGLKLSDPTALEALATEFDKGENTKVGADSLRARAAQLRAAAAEAEAAAHAKETAQTPPATAEAPETVTPPAAE